MKSKMRFKIGEFSKLCQVTVKTLRHYEEIGLLIPFEVDEWTGYRYYDIGQLRQMTRIVYLKRLGFSLEEIAELFNDGKIYPDSESMKVKMNIVKTRSNVYNGDIPSLSSWKVLSNNKKTLWKKYLKNHCLQEYLQHTAV
ncbi:helix-turn-helix domain-containing protein [uncultured Sanguibacteroides sp.]|uniref:MerR family transcriptional regulator n=1 Tax=uncultured Sanguibacteroides sp. TaxID=1635151 RepID=UPI0025D80585|nr:helix-turn-helix domain-containing protein [uncultured Sanguibacteroides sp.]